MAIEVIPVRSNRDLRQFIKFPWSVYSRDPHWVPPLIGDVKETLNPRRNPFFDHGEAELFLAKENRRVVGRIAAIINYNHNEYHNERTGFFGFFEVVPQYEIAETLLARACDWLRERQMEVARGPASFSTNDEHALLIEGFDQPPVVMMPYNPKYYRDFLERFGFGKAKDLLGYVIKIAEDELPEEFARLLGRLESIQARRGNVTTLRKANVRAFDEEIEIIGEIYNSAWEKNWGFVPMTDRELQHMATRLKRFLDPDLVFIAEIGGKPVGFALAIPDVNQALKRLNGRLFPFGIFKFLWASRRIDTFRFIAQGIKEPYRNRGINALYYSEMFKAGREKGYKKADFSWILEDNWVVTSIVARTGAELRKKYRIYDLQLH